MFACKLLQKDYVLDVVCVSPFAPEILSDPVEYVDIEASTCAVEEMFGTLTEFMSSSDSII